MDVLYVILISQLKAPQDKISQHILDLSNIELVRFGPPIYNVRFFFPSNLRNVTVSLKVLIPINWLINPRIFM